VWRIIGTVSVINLAQQRNFFRERQWRLLIREISYETATFRCKHESDPPITVLSTNPRHQTDVLEVP
jgi:hypothetical protein